jgi:uncharacterized protein
MQPQNSPGEVPAPQLPTPPVTPSFFQSTRRLHVFWKLVLFAIFPFVIAPIIVGGIALALFGQPFNLTSVRLLLLFEVGGFALVYAASAVMSLLEKRNMDDYGLPLRLAFRGNFWLGFLLGLAEISVLTGCIVLFGGYEFATLSLHGLAILRWGLLHLVLFIFVGLYEEFLFRGYLQFTAGTAFGFWPAALVLSLGFGAAHLQNFGENWVGALSVALIGLLFAFTLQRTGNLWYAVGLHAGFDWGESFLYSLPDSGSILEGHLSNAVLHGPRWLTGGTVGPEGSVFCFLTMALQFLVVLVLFPKKSPTS